MKKNGLFRAASLSLAVIMGLVFFTSCKSEADAPPNSSEISVPNAEMPNDSRFGQRHGAALSSRYHKT